MTKNVNGYLILNAILWAGIILGTALMLSNAAITENAKAFFLYSQIAGWLMVHGKLARKECTF